MKAELCASICLVCISLLLLAGCQQEMCPEGIEFRMRAQGENLSVDARLQHLAEAIDSYRACQEQVRSERARLEVQADVNDLTREFAQIALGIVDAKPSHTIPQSEDAIWRLEQIQEYDDPNGTLQSALAAYRRTRDALRIEVNQLLESSLKHMEQREWTAAAADVEMSLSVDPSNPRAKDTLRTIVSRRDVYYTERIAELCDEGKWKDGEVVLAEFRLELPGPDESVIARLAGRVTEAKEKIVREQAISLLNERKYHTAYRLIKDTNAKECSDLLVASIDEGTGFYTNLANEENRNVRDFHAYAAAVKALEIAGTDNDEVFKLHRDCADRVNDSIQINIGIAPFAPLGSEPELGAGLANELLSHLYERLPYGIHLDERKRIEFALENVDETRQVVRLLDLKWAVFGDVESNVDSQRDEREVTTWVQVPKMVPNPHYQQELQATLDRTGRLLPGAEKPEAFVMSNSPEQVRYRMGKEKLHGQIKLSARIYSAEEGYLIPPRDFIVIREIEDTFRDEVAEANIVGDPLELPTNLVFMQELRKELVEKVANWLLENLGQRQRHFYEQAERYIERREFDLAVQAAVQGYLYCLHDNVPESDAWFRKLRQLVLFDLTEPSPQR